jgi:ferredoxin-NADP reductase
MEEYIVKILRIDRITHNVRRYRYEKPKGYRFMPGQATDVSINTEKWKNEKRPFTFTCLNDETYLEFTIKSYTDHDGMTNALWHVKPGDELIIRDVWGAINYDGPGVFIAGGAGITPFIAIFRQLYKEGAVNGNRLIFSNKTSEDIILKDEFTKILGNNFLNTLTREKNPLYDNRRIDAQFLKEKIVNFRQHFYICGPDRFVTEISETLKQLGADPQSVIVEK